ncbi:MULTISPECIES: hypothetical protein [Bifidobacterium]|uniref:hypothetical protein n=1 Tax=Bifidobacterium TaxID=1678 RepID=UPI001BDBB618|nr:MULTISPECIES: hypothetical protein [Bifidobacterium]MBT1161542.1 hypothetical protein [Bifidobacterium sp. SO1]MBW3078918.1 hypothetical protein [Bifidobacterium simiiventris]
MVQRKSGRPIGQRTPRKRKLSRKQQAIYRRRRIVAVLALMITIALIGFCGYSLVRGIGAIGAAINHDEIYAISRGAVPDPPKSSGIKDCAKGTVSLTLTPAAQSVPVGGSLNFTATITYTGSSKVGCLVDGSDANRVLTISSGNQTIWRSDVCPADPRMLLMSKGDADQQQITWNANSTGTSCADDGTLPRVNAGTYTARLSLKDQPEVVSDPVTILVQ